MANPDDPRSDDPELDSDEDDEVSSPFDHPFFLPVLLFAFALWFGYDGWFSEEFARESTESLPTSPGHSASRSSRFVTTRSR